ncbi:uncharacterized protein EI97DRAFT_286785 [Westerdykella ornata]|uniref:RNA helicase HEL117 n=1 Tax=Westerdykella ornata TaxID=318751 RepID=A0A6A6J411_WESOR|nr:uncharacterized protein EI97DRAFT_286785 [Westerdykella ornata]KAF2271311.1 hypothetical protein EI97DRAFT_286785 [Westerdykella ornata]
MPYRQGEEQDPPSPSPDRQTRRPHTLSRSRSPDRENRKSRRHNVRNRSPPPQRIPLPFNAPRLSKRQLAEYKPLFQSYLEIQKRLKLDELEEREVRGRWKSFVSHWNRGELARSWYDPSMLKTAKETVSAYRRSRAEPKLRDSPTYDPQHMSQIVARGESQSEDDFGPTIPRHVLSRRTGPTMPKVDDLALRDQLNAEDRMRMSSNYRDDVRYERKEERKAQKERLEELVPRADPGSRERQLEKKREATSTLNEFRNAKEGGDAEVGDADLLGTDDMDEYKRSRREMERKKSEREIRREEMMRARAVEREEKLAEFRQKEAATMEYLKAIAKDRFG